MYCLILLSKKCCFITKDTVCTMQNYHTITKLCVISTYIVIMYTSQWKILRYLVVQAGLLTPLTFAWLHRLSPLAAFIFGAYFLHSGQQWQWICTASFKGIFGGPLSECVWQQAITCCLCYRMPQNAFFPQTCDLLISQKTMQTLLFHPPSTFPGNFCDCNSGGIYTALQF